MRQAIIKSGLSDRIAITGYLHEPMLLRELKSATVLVVPSLLEGFGLIAADAMKLGMCVIVSDAAGLKSLIDDGRTGLVFRSGDDAALAAAIQKAVADPELRRRLGEAAFIEAQKRFSYPDRVKDLQLVFDRVFGKN
jgi:glycosyltransferase involved in cell wall biosynthesis